mgnify:FL=1
MLANMVFAYNNTDNSDISEENKEKINKVWETLKGSTLVDVEEILNKIKEKCLNEVKIG